MKTRFMGILAGALVVAAFGAPSASAATEFGDSCVADEITEENSVSLFEVSSPENPLPTAAPSAGVITKWKMNIVPVPFTIPTTLKVLHRTGGNSAQIVGESAQNPTGGSNSFDTRIPVQAGDRLAIFGPSEFGTLFCELPTESAVIGGFLGGGGGVGSSVTIVEEPAAARVPVSASIEPDADNDGYGDETQDKCPQSAATQAPCPVVALSSSASAKKGLATVLITASSQATVTVGGTVKLGKGKPATLSGGTQVVLPGVIAKFTLLFTQKLKAKLKQLTPKQSLTLNVSVSAPNVVGAPTVSSLKVKLKGQKKAKRKGPKKGK